MIIKSYIILISFIYILFPVKIIFSNNQESSFKITPVLYGLPTKAGWDKIRLKEYYPGGDVVNLFNPKYIISVKVR